MITYNHELYIKQAIDSVLMQKIIFPIELVIGDDCSSDKTYEICESYQRRYPDIIKLSKPKINLGMIENFTQTLLRCRGKYIALCEGDDYWIDRNKLTKQVKFLEVSKNYSACFHNAQVIYTNTLKKPHFYNTNMKEKNDFIDLIFENQIATCSIVFTNNFLKYSSGLLKDILLIDDNLHLFNAQFGKLKYFNETMSVYRIHDGGTWSQQSLINKAKETIPIKLSAYKFFKNTKYKKYFRQSIGISYFKLADALLADNQLLSFMKNNIKGLFYLTYGRTFNLRRVFKEFYPIYLSLRGILKTLNV